MAQRYGQRPSALVGIPTESPVALALDYAVAVRAILEEEQRTVSAESAMDRASVMHADDLPIDTFVRF